MTPPPEPAAGLAHARGRVAEQVAATLLRDHGLTVLERNFRVTGAELDLVCRDGDELVFVEVRARGPGGPAPSATLDGRKLSYLLRGARAWLAAGPDPEPPWRLEVVSVTLDGAGRPVAAERITDPFVHLPEFHHADP